MDIKDIIIDTLAYILLYAVMLTVCGAVIMGYI